MLQIFLNAFFGLKLSRNIEEGKLCQIWPIWSLRFEQQRGSSKIGRSSNKAPMNTGPLAWEMALVRQFREKNVEFNQFVDNTIFSV